MDELGYQQSYQNQYHGNYKRGGYGGRYKKTGGYYKKNQDNYIQNQEQQTEKSIYNQKENYQIDSYSAHLLIYRAEMYIILKYPYLIDLNKKNAEMSKKISDKSLFFVIKSFSEEDVHKAIKFNVWSSTKSGNQSLNNAYKLAKSQGGEVYLLFSSNGSGRFVGVAKMASEVDMEKMFLYWTQDTKWLGMMSIEWLFIKDVPFKEYKDIVIMMKNGERRPVSNSRDTQEVPLSDGKKMLEIFDNYLNSNTILEHFEYYDIRQENYEKNNPKLLNQNIQGN